MSNSGINLRAIEVAIGNKDYAFLNSQFYEALRLPSFEVVQKAAWLKTLCQDKDIPEKVILSWLDAFVVAAVPDDVEWIYHFCEKYLSDPGATEVPAEVRQQAREVAGDIKMLCLSDRGVDDPYRAFEVKGSSIANKIRSIQTVAFVWQYPDACVYLIDHVNDSNFFIRESCIGGFAIFLGRKDIETSADKGVVDFYNKAKSEIRSERNWHVLETLRSVDRFIKLTSDK